MRPKLSIKSKRKVLGSNPDYSMYSQGSSILRAKTHQKKSRGISRPKRPLGGYKSHRTKSNQATKKQAGAWIGIKKSSRGKKNIFRQENSDTTGLAKKKFRPLGVSGKGYTFNNRLVNLVKP